MVVHTARMHRYNTSHIARSGGSTSTSHRSVVNVLDLCQIDVGSNIRSTSELWRAKQRNALDILYVGNKGNAKKSLFNSCRLQLFRKQGSWSIVVVWWSKFCFHQQTENLLSSLVFKTGICVLTVLLYFSALDLWCCNCLRRSTPNC